MPFSFTVNRGVLLLLLFYSGLLPFVPLGESLLQFYLPRIINRWVCRRVHVSLHIIPVVPDKCVTIQTCLLLFSLFLCLWRTFIPEKRILRNKMVISLLEKWVKFPYREYLRLKKNLQLTGCFKWSNMWSDAFMQNYILKYNYAVYLTTT